MYRLIVRHPGRDQPTESVDIPRSSEVLMTIPLLLERHADCESVDVLYNGGRLFSVDCKGNRID